MSDGGELPRVIPVEPTDGERLDAIILLLEANQKLLEKLLEQLVQIRGRWQ